MTLTQADVAAHLRRDQIHLHFDGAMEPAGSGRRSSYGLMSRVLSCRSATRTLCNETEKSRARRSNAKPTSLVALSGSPQRRRSTLGCPR